MPSTRRYEGTFEGTFEGTKKSRLGDEKFALKSPNLIG